jgi:hypothetical protein
VAGVCHEGSVMAHCAQPCRPKEEEPNKAGSMDYFPLKPPGSGPCIATGDLPLQAHLREGGHR